MELANMLQPGITIRPVVNLDDIARILKELYGLRLVNVKELNGYDDKNFHVLVADDIENTHIETMCRCGYVLKIVNSLDSKNPQLFEAQNELMIYLGKKGINCPMPIQTKHGSYTSVENFSSGQHIVRVLEYISGIIIYEVPSSPSLFYHVGQFVGKIDTALKEFHHPIYDTYKSIWSLDSVPRLPEFLFVIKDDQKRKIVEDVLTKYNTRVLPASNGLAKGIIHGDFNEQNILADKVNDEWRMQSVLDFGDVHHTCYLYELAITMTYMILQGKDVEIGGYVLAGYSSTRKVPEVEFNLLKVCIESRLCQSVVLGAYSSLQDPDNAYILTTQVEGWLMLEKIWRTPEDELLDLWKRTSENFLELMDYYSEL